MCASTPLERRTVIPDPPIGDPADVPVVIQTHHFSDILSDSFDWEHMLPEDIQ